MFHIYKISCPENHRKQADLKNDDYHCYSWGNVSEFGELFTLHLMPVCTGEKPDSINVLMTSVPRMCHLWLYNQFSNDDAPNCYQKRKKLIHDQKLEAV